MARRMRVLTLSDDLPRAGGAERVAAYLALGLDRSRFAAHVCTTRTSSGELIDRVRAELPLLQLDRSRRGSLGAFAPLVRLLRRERIDVLHSHQFGSNVWGVLLGRLARVPVVVAHEHTWSYEGEPLRRFLDRELIGRGADAFVAVSREDRRRMIEVERVPAGKTVFMPNGIPPVAAPSGRSVRAELGIPPRAPVIGSLSVLRTQKRVDVMLRAAAILVRERPSLRLLVPGAGPEEASLRALAAALGLGDVVSFLSVRTDAPDYLEALDVAVNSSDFEGSPLSVLEFMAAGKAVVATRVGGVPDLIEHGVHGLLVPAGDPDALAQAVARLLDAPGLRRGLGERARERQAREFTVAAMVGRFEDLYDRLVRARRGGTESR